VIPEIFISTGNSRQAVLDTVLLGFSSDPLITSNRWLGRYYAQGSWVNACWST